MVCGNMSASEDVNVGVGVSLVVIVSEGMSEGVWKHVSE